jgi:hypothetical protein
MIAGLGMMALTAAYAQQNNTELERTVVVENQYNPTVMDASKINVLPKVEEPSVPKSNIDYVTSLRPVSAWNYQSMGLMPREQVADAIYRGWFRAGYGTHGNVDVKAGYEGYVGSKDRLGVAASLDGWNGELAGLNEEDWTSRLYDTRLGLDYRHSFRKTDLALGGYYRSQVFNYLYPLLAEAPAGKQHQTMANAHIGLASTDQDMAVQFSGEIGMNYFKQKYPAGVEAGSETNFYAKGDVLTPFLGRSFGLALDLNTYSYAMGEMKNNTSLEMNPYYKMEYGDWRFRVGAHLDWWSGAENQMNVSPDLNVELNFLDSYVLYAQAGGGRENKSLMELTDVTPYWALAQPYLLPTYVTLDAQLGLKASPANGWWFNLTGGYQMREDDLFFGVADEKGMTAAFAQADSKVAYGAAELKYDYKDLFDCTLKATYYHWDLSKPKEQDGQVKQITLALKPELEVNAEVGMKPMSGLRVNVGYEYVKRCEGLYDPISNLYLGADYALLKNLSVYGQIRNLMNKEYVRADAYPAQKMNALVGLSLRF